MKQLFIFALALAAVIVLDELWPMHAHAQDLVLAIMGWDDALIYLAITAATSAASAAAAPDQQKDVGKGQGAQLPDFRGITPQLRGNTAPQMMNQYVTGLNGSQGQRGAPGAAPSAAPRTMQPSPVATNGPSGAAVGGAGGGGISEMLQQLYRQASGGR